MRLAKAARHRTQAPAWKQRSVNANSRDSVLRLSEAQRSGSVNSRESGGESRESGHKLAVGRCGRSCGSMSRPALHWGQLNPQQERDVRELVRHVAGLQDEADPNFQLALHFAWSNFRCAAWLPGRG